MKELHRRSFVQLALSSIPFAVFGAAPTQGVPRSAVPVVRSGEDREGGPPKRSGTTTYKVLTQDTGGGLFVLEQLHKTIGGPHRHLHHEQDELFYVVAGEYVFEIGSERFRLKSGDSVLGPRGIPHAYLFVGDTPGRLLIAYTPAGKMEAFFRRSAPPLAADATPQEVTARTAAAYADYGMQYLGPPLVIE